MCKLYLSVRPPRKSVSLSLDEPVIQKTKELAQQSFFSFPRYVNRVLTDHIKQMEADETAKNEKPLL